MHHACVYVSQGRDELSGDQVGPKFPPVANKDAPLNYEEVKEKFDKGESCVCV